MASPLSALAGSFQPPIITFHQVEVFLTAAKAELSEAERLTETVVYAYSLWPIAIWLCIKIGKPPNNPPGRREIDHSPLGQGVFLLKYTYMFKKMISGPANSPKVASGVKLDLEPMRLCPVLSPANLEREVSSLTISHPMLLEIDL